MKYVFFFPALCIATINAGITPSHPTPSLKIVGEIFQKDISSSDLDNGKLLASCCRIMSQHGWSELETNPITPNPNYNISFHIPSVTDFRNKQVTFTYATTINTIREQKEITLAFGSSQNSESNHFLTILKVLD